MSALLDSVHDDLPSRPAPEAMVASARDEPTGRLALLVSEARKIPAFFRRDFLVILSYRLAFVTDWLSLLVQIALFAFVGLMVDPAVLPAAAGRPVSYLEFVTVGIAISGFVQVGLGRVVAVVRDEQLMGTLESLLLTPTTVATIQLGSAIYDLVYVPLRTVVFLALVAAIYHVGFAFEQLGPALAVLAAFIPVVWGLGLTSAAAVLTFRRGSGAVGFGVAMLTATSGAYFPVQLLPAWTHTLMQYNPLTITLDATRDALLGGMGWPQIASDVLMLLPMAAVSLMVGTSAFRLALERELRRGTLSHY
ncbi:MAG: ABC transporter permease [Actinomycetota bacterium]|nr:ABC transporter permease [Actinomycetota bacterium]